MMTKAEKPVPTEKLLIAPRAVDRSVWYLGFSLVESGNASIFY